jgi:hypothetical protein
VRALPAHLRFAMIVGAMGLCPAAAPVRLNPRFAEQSSWSAPGVSLTKRGDFVEIQLDCSMIRANLPDGLPNTGHFAAAGLRLALRPGPQDADRPPGEEPVRVSGAIMGGRMRLEISAPGKSTVVRRLTRGGRHGPIRCL